MSYRDNPRPEPTLPPRAPWWRILRASIDGTLRRWKGRERVFIVTEHGGGWVRRDGRGLLGPPRFTDEEIDRHLPPSLRRTP